MIWVDTKEWGRIEADSLDALLKDLAQRITVYGSVSILQGSGLGNPLDFERKIELARREYGPEGM